MKLSVVIPCFRGMKTMPALLASLERQTFQRNQFEVIVVDDGSDDGTRELLARTNGVRVIEQANKGPGEARNAGFDAAKGELVLFLDSDVDTHENLISTHVEYHTSHPEIAATGGSVIPAGSYGLLSWALTDHFCSWFNAHPGVKHSSQPEYLPSLNFCVKKNMLLAEKQIRWLDGLKVTGEDVLFCRSLRTAGLKLAFVPQAVVRHCDRTNMKSYLHHMRRWGMHAPSVRGRCPELKYGFLFPRSRAKLMLTVPLIIGGYTALIWLAWIRVRPVAVTLALPQILLGRIAYASGVIAGTASAGQQLSTCE